MRVTRWMAIATAVGALGLAGCGGDDDDPGDGQRGAGQGGGASERPAPTATPETEAGGGSGGQGKDIFARTCGGCHTLGAAATTGGVGPNLDDLKPDRDTVLNAIRTGPGQMPENLLEGDDAEIVADFVSESAGS